MRIEVTFNCDKGAKIDFNYNHNLSRLIMESLFDNKSAMFHKGRPFKYYTFSQLYFSQYEISGDKIVNLGEEVHWYISSPNPFFIDGIMKGLTRICCYPMGQGEFEFKQVRLLDDPEFTNDMEFTCMSPITISSMGRGAKRELYCRIENKCFVENLRYDLVQKYYYLYNSFPKNERLEIIFDKNYLENKKRTSRLIDYNGVKVLGYMVPFVVKGSPDLIRVGYSCGFGERNNNGFGMVKVWHRS